MSDEEFTAADYDALPEVLTPQQVAKILNTSDVMVRRWAGAGVIPGRQFGNRWRFSKTALEEMIRTGTPRDQIVQTPDDDDEDTATEPA